MILRVLLASLCLLPGLLGLAVCLLGYAAGGPP
jgi:hypothetical protein